jgi:protein O-mannosyl-transferase
MGILVVFWMQRRRQPYLLMGWLWFVGTLVPVIGLVQAGGQSIADRYTYLPSIGMLVCGVWGAYELTRGWRSHVLGWWAAGGAAIVICLVLTPQQLGHWKDGEALFRHALQVTADNHIAHNNLGVAIGMKGQIDEAISQLQESVRLKPDYADAHSNLGNALLIKGQMDEAIHQLQEAVRLKPDHVAAHYNLGIALGAKGQLDEAIGQYQETMRLNADYADVKGNLAKALELKSKSKLRASDALKP